MRMRLITVGAAALALTSAPSAAGAATVYTIDPKASSVRLHVDKAGLFSLAGHTHEIAAPVAEGRLEIDRGDPARSTVHVVFDASALRVIGKGEPAEDVPEVQRTMESERVLDVSQFPRISFDSRSVQVLERAGDQLRIRVQGDLTLHGRTRQETAVVTVAKGERRVTAKGTCTINASDGR